MLICDRCGELADENDLETIHDRDYVDNGLGMECIRDDEFYKKCSCGGDWVKATECLICGDWFNDEKSRYVCDYCLEENATFENALKMGDDEDCQENIKLNGYILTEFSKSQIEQILTNLLKQTHDLKLPLKYEKFLLNDKDYFAEWLEQENK